MEKLKIDVVLLNSIKPIIPENLVGRKAREVHMKYLLIGRSMYMCYLMLHSKDYKNDTHTPWCP